MPGLALMEVRGGGKAKSEITKNENRFMSDANMLSSLNLYILKPTETSYTHNLIKSTKSFKAFI